MILKKQPNASDKKSNPLIGILLLFVSISLFFITTPLGFIFAIFHSFFTKKLIGIGDYFLKLAISIDQLGNVIMQHLLNVLWIKKGGYKFGNRDETISSALGRNKQLQALTKFGLIIDTILDKIEPNHSLNSIDYYVEPSGQVIDTLAWIHIKNNQLLGIKSKGAYKFYIPRAMREKGQSDFKALLRQLNKELKIELDMNSLTFIGIFEAKAEDQKPSILIRTTCYSGDYFGALHQDFEIEELAWLSYNDKSLLSEVDQLIFDYLHLKGLLH